MIGKKGKKHLQALVMILLIKYLSEEEILSMHYLSCVVFFVVDKNDHE